jgi:ribonuclease P/MRP protein subunit RPP40
MTHGKKAFSRLEWACANVLDQSLSWLFYNFNPSSHESLRAGAEPISSHHPSIRAIEPSTTKLPRTLVPILTTSHLASIYDTEDALALHEYIAMLALASPRIAAADDIDPHLSRYEVPTFNGLVELAMRDMVRVRWRGFLPPQFVQELFLLVRKVGLKVEKGRDAEGEEEERWVAWSATAFGGVREWTVMQWAGRETLVWECEG